MGLFGNKKKEQELQSIILQKEEEISKLKQMICPEQKQLNELNEKINIAAKEYSKIESDLKTMQEKFDSMKKENEIEEGVHSRKLNSIKEKCDELEAFINLYEERVNMIEIGVYTPKYDFESIDEYKEKLAEFKEREKFMVRNQTYASWNHNWTINGNLQAGRKMADDFKKLLLRAFNNECDELMRKVTPSNYDTYLKRLKASCDSISKLGKMVDIHITSGYLHLKIEELNLALDYAQFKQNEKERIRELKAQQREEAKAQKEIEEARKKLQKEQAHYQNAMQQLLTKLESDPENSDLIAKKAELEANLNDIQKAIEDVDYREANKRAGYVYIISNIGAFGENVYKIGMTRRLEPMDRVNELGDASVPFKFDVHALIFTEDAPALESALHNAFADNKVNKINPRREFFRVSLEEIKKVVRENFDKTVEWIEIPEAEQYRQSIAMERLSANK